MTLRRLVLWRHGQTDDNAAQRVQGHIDSPLNETGQEQARRAAPVIAGFRPAVAFSSDLRRATDTVAEFTSLTGMPVGQDKRLREMFMGDWQGLTYDEVDRRWPGQLTRWRWDPEQAPPGGEPLVEVAARAHAVVEELESAHDGTALLCCHGGVIRALAARMLGLPLQAWPAIGVIGNCRWTVLTRWVDGPDRWRLATYNCGFTE